MIVNPSRYADLPAVACMAVRSVHYTVLCCTGCTLFSFKLIKAWSGGFLGEWTCPSMTSMLWLATQAIPAWVSLPGKPGWGGQLMAVAMGIVITNKMFAMA